MSSVPLLREFISGRLTAAAAQIFNQFEQTIVRYEEQIDGQRRLLDVTWRGRTEPHKAELHQQHVCKEETRSSTLDQDQPETPQIKNEPEFLQIGMEPELVLIEEDADPPEVKKEAGPPWTPQDEEDLPSMRAVVHLSADDRKSVREFISQQLTAAAAEMSSRCEQTLVQYEDEVDRQRRLLDAVSHCTDTHQPHVCKEEQLWDQEESLSVDQDQPGSPLEEEEVDQDGGEPETDVFLEASPYEGSEHSEPEPGRQQLLSQKPVPAAAGRDQDPERPGASSRKAELKLKKRKHRSKKHMNHVDHKLRPHASKKPFTCEVCGKSFTIKKAWIYHMSTHTGEKPHTCEVCGKGFITKTALRYHMRTHTGEKPHSCQTCGRSYYQQNQLKIHMRSHTGEKPYVCERCGKAFAIKTILAVHMRTHTGEKPFICSTCGKKFTTSSHLKKHMIIIHREGGPCSCKMCGKPFRHPRELSVHMKLSHQLGKSHTCDTCGKCFIRRCHLQRHMMTHTGEKPFACEMCGKGFRTKSNLIRHMGTHTGENRVSCKMCGKCLRDRSTLSIHMRSHTGEKPYACAVCGKSFSVKRSMSRHMKIHEIL